MEDPTQEVHILNCICHEYRPNIDLDCAEGALLAPGDRRYCLKPKAAHPVVDLFCRGLRKRLKLYYDEQWSEAE